MAVVWQGQPKELRKAKLQMWKGTASDSRVHVVKIVGLMVYVIWEGDCIGNINMNFRLQSHV